MLFETPDAAERPTRVCITAGAGGLGRAITDRFFAAGARVHICDASAEAVVATLSECAGVHGTVADVGNPAEVRDFIAEAVEWMGGIDVLVNGAAFAGPRCALEAISDSEWDRTLAVNLSGVFYALREVVPIMKRQGEGAIVNVASASARTGLPKRLAYVTSKSAVIALTYNVARELGPDNIRCNAVLPGIIDNAAGRRLVDARARENRVPWDEAEADLLRHVSLRSWIDPVEVADMVHFLASKAARHISGQAIGVCGNLEWDG